MTVIVKPRIQTLEIYYESHEGKEAAQKVNEYVKGKGFKFYVFFSATGVYKLRLKENAFHEQMEGFKDLPTCYTYFKNLKKKYS